MFLSALEIGWKMMIEDFQFTRPILITGVLCAQARGRNFGQETLHQATNFAFNENAAKRKWINKLKQLPFSLNAATGVSGTVGIGTT